MYTARKAVRFARRLRRAESKLRGIRVERFKTRTPLFALRVSHNGSHNWPCTWTDGYIYDGTPSTDLAIACTPFGAPLRVPTNWDAAASSEGLYDHWTTLGGETTPGIYRYMPSIYTSTPIGSYYYGQTLNTRISEMPELNGYGLNLHSMSVTLRCHFPVVYTTYQNQTAYIPRSVSWAIILLPRSVWQSDSIWTDLDHSSWPPIPVQDDLEYTTYDWVGTPPQSIPGTVKFPRGLSAVFRFNPYADRTDTAIPSFGQSSFDDDTFTVGGETTGVGGNFVNNRQRTHPPFKLFRNQDQTLMDSYRGTVPTVPFRPRVLARGVFNERRLKTYIGGSFTDLEFTTASTTTTVPVTNTATSVGTVEAVAPGFPVGTTFRHQMATYRTKRLRFKWRKPLFVGYDKRVSRIPGQNSGIGMNSQGLAQSVWSGGFKLQNSGAATGMPPYTWVPSMDGTYLPTSNRIVLVSWSNCDSSNYPAAQAPILSARVVRSESDP